MLTIIEKIANAMGRPFGLDFYLDHWCKWTEFARYEFGMERGVGAGASKVWMGPFHIAVCRV